MSPPTRSSIRWPSTVWVLMICHSSLVELAGLVDDLLRHRRSCRRRAAGPRTRRCAGRRVEPELVGDLDGERTTPLRVLAGVCVVRLDHVAEHERGAPVGVVELDELLQTAVALAREDAEQRRTAARRAARPTRALRSRAPWRGRPGTARGRPDRPMRTSLTSSRSRDAVAQALADGVGAEVAANCAASRATSTQIGCTAPCGPIAASRTAGPDREPAVAGHDQQAAGRRSARHYVGRHAERHGQRP